MKARKEKNWLAKAFSYNRFRRRKKGKLAQTNYISDDLFDPTIITINDSEVRYTHGSDTDVTEHLKKLRFEFIGRPQYCFNLAATIVLIRREFNLSQQIENFYMLWEHCSDGLIKNLSSRWLVSAGDTFADHGKSKEDQTAGLWASLLINTVKAYEMKALLQKQDPELQPLAEQIHLSQTSRIALFDGVSGLAAGTDDTFRNMRWRLEKIANQKNAYAAKIGLEIFERLSENPTAYKFMRDIHTRSRNAWWR